MGSLRNPTNHSPGMKFLGPGGREEDEEMRVIKESQMVAEGGAEYI